MAAATATAGVLVSAGPAGATIVKPFELAYSGKIYGGFLTIGNAVLVCPPVTPACIEAMKRESTKGNNNDFDMQYADGAPDLRGYDSATSRITIPGGAKVAWAHLDWAGNTGAYVLGKSRLRRCDASAPGNAVLPPGDPLTAPVRLKFGSEPTKTLTAESAASTPASEGGPQYYTATADVAGELSKAPTGVPVDVSVADLWAPTGYGCIGGWSLTVVYKYPKLNAEHAPQARAVYVYEGHVLQRSNDPATTTDIAGFQTGAQDPVQAGVTAYEGDFNVPGSRFAVNGALIANSDRPGAGTSKFFDSYAEGTVSPDFPNNMSVDAKDFTIPSGIVPLGSTQASLTFATKGDTYLVQAFALSVPIPDVGISEAPVPRTVFPDEKIDYGVTVTDKVDVPEPDDEVTVHLGPVLTDAIYDHDASASTGTVSYDAGDLVWKGSLDPGEEAKIRFAVTTIDHPGKDARLREYVVGEGRKLACDHGDGTGCADTTELVAPVVVGCGAGAGGPTVGPPAVRVFAPMRTVTPQC